MVNRVIMIRAVAALLLLLLLGASLYPLLIWDPTGAGEGGAGYQRLREWSELTRSDGDTARREELRGTFGVQRSHLGRLWYTASDDDGRCWVLSVEPVAVLPEVARDGEWCRR